MVYRKLDKVPGEMCAAADEDLWCRNMRGVRVRIFDLRKGEVHRILGRSDRGCEGGKDEETHVDDPLCDEFTPSEGIKECLQPSMPRQEIGCPDVRVLCEIRKTFGHPRERGGVIEFVEYEL